VAWMASDSTRKADPTRLTAGPSAGADLMITEAESPDAVHRRWPEKPLFVSGARELRALGPYVSGFTVQNPEDSKWAGMFQSAVIQSALVKYGNTIVEIRNRSDFPF